MLFFYYWMFKKKLRKKKVVNNTSIQQTFETEFEEYYQQCEDCQKEFTPHTWNGLVQVRFFFLIF